MNTGEPAPPRPRRGWFDEAFQDDYLDVYAHRDLSEAARAVRFLTDALALSPQHTVLDLCCGPGRHMACLVGRVGRVIGVDLSPALLQRARVHLQAAAAALPATGARSTSTESVLIRADMRRIPLADASVDRLINWFTSFGYFERDEENEAVMAEMVRVLKPGGSMAIDHINRAALLATLQPRTEHALPGGRRLIQERRLDASSRRVVKYVALESPDGLVQTWRESVRLYDADELEAMMTRTGLQPYARKGDYDGGRWRPDAPRLIVLARREG